MGPVGTTTTETVVDVTGRDGTYLGAWRVLEHSDGRMTLERILEPTIDEVRAELGHRAMTADEFEQHFGHLPVDPQG